MSDAATIDASAASSPASAPTSSVNLEALSPEARQHWRLTGDVPTEAASSSAPPPDTSETDRTAATAAKAQPASDAGAPDTTTAPKAGEDIEYKAKTKERIDTLLRENAELKRLQSERDRAAASSKPTAPSTTTTDAPASVPLPEFVENPAADQPLLKAEQFFQQFPDAAYEDFTRYAVNHALAVRDAHSQRMQAQQRMDAQRAERIDAFVKRASEPGFVEKLHPDVANLVPAEMLPAGTVPNARNVLAQEIMLSENAKPMLQALTSDDLASVDRLTDVASVIRFCARLEARVAGGSTPPVAPSKTVSDAPDLGTTVGSKAKAASDPVDQAIADDDFRTFRELENAREAKRLRR